jgi:hypothetical protein
MLFPDAQWVASGRLACPKVNIDIDIHIGFGTPLAWRRIWIAYRNAPFR